MTTGEITGNIDEQLDRVEEERKELKTLKRLRDEVLKELENKYHLEKFNEFKTQFDEFLTLLEEHLQTGSKESKKAILDKIPIVKDVNKW